MGFGLEILIPPIPHFTSTSVMGSSALAQWNREFFFFVGYNIPLYTSKSLPQCESHRLAFQKRKEKKKKTCKLTFRCCHQLVPVYKQYTSSVSSLSTKKDNCSTTRQRRVFSFLVFPPLWWKCIV